MSEDINWKQIDAETEKAEKRDALLREAAEALKEMIADYEGITVGALPDDDPECPTVLTDARATLSRIRAVLGEPE